MPIGTVLFDLGSTLWHIPELPPVERIRQETVGRIMALLRSWGIEPEDRHRFLGRDIRLAVTDADRRAYDTHCESPDFTALVRKVAARHGLDLTPEESEQLWHTWNLEGSFFGRRLFDDALETLTSLKERGYRLGCVTNRVFGGPHFHAELEEHGLAELFDTLAVSCTLGYMKPHPKIYERALEDLGAEPAETAMVGDSLRADVAGAQALGITAVWRRLPDSSEQLDGVRPDFVIQELRDLLSIPLFAPGGASPR